MTIGGFQGFSLNEYPGRIAAIVFCQGCNFRCPYCHNPELVDPDRYTQPWPESRVLDALASRRGQLQGVVITGGEPTLQTDLERFIRDLRGLGFRVKLDTNGSNPDVLAHLLSAGLIDHVGLDVKAPPDKYAALTRAEISPATIARSISTLLAAGIDHEIRTTWVPSLLSQSDLIEIAHAVKGCRRWVVQRFVSSKTLDPALLGELPPDNANLAEVREIIEKIGVSCVVR